MFIGEHRCALDDKGRLNFPAKFREEMNGDFIVTRWLDDCLVAFPQTEWERMADLLSKNNRVKSRDMQRLLYSGASPVNPDKQGRILVPMNLRKHASLQKEVVVIGVGKHAEIWNAEAWEERTEMFSDESFAAAMEELDF